MAFDMQSKGNAATQPTAPMHTAPINSAPTVGQVQAQAQPQQNMLQQVAPMLEQLAGPSVPPPVMQQPQQFAGPSQSGKQLQDFLANLMKNRGM